MMAEQPEVLIHVFVDLPVRIVWITRDGAVVEEQVVVHEVEPESDERV